MQPTTQRQSATFQWQLNWKLLLFALILFPVLVSLGLWQLDRADQKKLILQELERNQDYPPMTELPQSVDENLQYRNIGMNGTLDGGRRIFLDNRVRHGQAGYEVFETLRDAQSGMLILVNRGWVAASLDRSVLPALPALAGSARYHGYLYRNLKTGFQLDDGIHSVEKWPVRLGWLSVERAAQLFGEPLFSYQLRLDQDSPGALETGWASVAIMPERHIGYAVQWFCMAAALLVMTLFANSNLVECLRNRGASVDD